MQATRILNCRCGNALVRVLHLYLASRASIHVADCCCWDLAGLDTQLRRIDGTTGGPWMFVAADLILGCPTMIIFVVVGQMCLKGDSGMVVQVVFQNTLATLVVCRGPPRPLRGNLAVVGMAQRIAKAPHGAVSRAVRE